MHLFCSIDPIVTSREKQHLGYAVREVEPEEEEQQEEEEEQEQEEEEEEEQEQEQEQECPGVLGGLGC